VAVARGRAEEFFEDLGFECGECGGVFHSLNIV
jgi:hypothetical protein